MYGGPAVFQFAVKLAPVWDAVASPVPVTLTLAVAVVVPDVPGTYCTMIVQAPPAFTTVPLAQVPPVIENVPPTVPTFDIAGPVVNVKGPQSGRWAVYVSSQK